jgi:hypothetical protein
MTSTFRRPKKLATAVTIAAALAALVFTSAASCSEKRQDAGVSGRNTGPADVINMPDGYSNVASKCEGPNRVYVIYHGSFDDPKPYGSIAVVANDPRCTSTTAPK